MAYILSNGKSELEFLTTNLAHRECDLSQPMMEEAANALGNYDGSKKISLHSHFARNDLHPDKNNFHGVARSAILANTKTSIISFCTEVGLDINAI